MWGEQPSIESVHGSGTDALLRGRATTWTTPSVHTTRKALFVSGGKKLIEFCFCINDKLCLTVAVPIAGNEALLPTQNGFRQTDENVRIRFLRSALPSLHHSSSVWILLFLCVVSRPYRVLLVRVRPSHFPSQSRHGHI